MSILQNWERVCKLNLQFTVRKHATAQYYIGCWSNSTKGFCHVKLAWYNPPSLETQFQHSLSAIAEYGTSCLGKVIKGRHDKLSELLVT